MLIRDEVGTRVVVTDGMWPSYRKPEYELIDELKERIEKLEQQITELELKFAGRNEQACKNCAHWEQPLFPKADALFWIASGWCPLHGEYKEPDQFCSEWEVMK